MTPIDMVLVGVWLLAGLIGLYTGLLRATLAVVAVVGSVWASALFGPDLAELLGRFVDSSSLARILAYALVALSVMFVCSGLTWLVLRTLSVFRLGWADRAAGSLIGLVGVLFCAVVVARALGVDGSAENSVGDSEILPALVTLAENFLSWLHAET
jgi:uncharacterized membrane protein required for colicin V production